MSPGVTVSLAVDQGATIGAAPMGDPRGMKLRQIGLIGAAMSFARTERGQRLIAQTRQKYDTPANRAKARDVLNGLRNSRRT
jgi:hypothetical protein